MTNFRMKLPAIEPNDGEWKGLEQACEDACRKGLTLDDVKEAVLEHFKNLSIDEDSEAVITRIVEQAYGASDVPLNETRAWRQVSTESVWEAIKGSPVMEVVQALQEVTDPPLPLEATLSKALVLAGGVMAGKIENAPAYNDQLDKRMGSALSRFRIMTGAGQTTNLWGLIVGPSGSGKDIGGFDDLTRYVGLSCGSSLSAEGMQDAFVTLGNGIISISELEPFIKQGSWQHSTLSWLNYSYDKGWFKSMLSTRQNNKSRETNYCFSSMIANIQPEIFAAYSDSSVVTNGFLPRCLVSLLPNKVFIASTKRQNMDRAVDALEYYRTLKGEVYMPDWYADDIRRCIAKLEQEGANLSIGSRLVQQMAPKIACILQADAKTITKETWQKTKTIVWWYLTQAEDLVETVGDNPRAAPFERLMARIYKGICRCRRLSKTQISRNFHRGSSAKEREQALDELEERNLIRQEGAYYNPVDGKVGLGHGATRTIFQTSFIKTPPEVLRLYGKQVQDDGDDPLAGILGDATTTSTTTTTVTLAKVVENHVESKPDELFAGMADKTLEPFDPYDPKYQ